jgi:hypothetical protein
MAWYHVSPRKNRDSIGKSGIEPIMSLGKLKVSWWVSERALLWAVAHCSARHSVSVAELDVWTYNHPQGLKNKTRTKWQGVVFTPCRVIPSGVIPAAIVVERLKLELEKNEGDENTNED